MLHLVTNRLWFCQAFFARIMEHVAANLKRTATTSQPAKRPRFYAKFCMNCCKDFPSAQLLLAHHNNTHGTNGTDVFACFECGEHFSVFATLQAHAKEKHDISDGKVCVCPECQSRFPTLGKLKRHFTTHTGVKNYRCETCGKQFSTRDNLTGHTKRVHDGVKKPRKFRCSYAGCSYAAQSKYALNEHTNRHTGAKPFVCDQCSTAFAAMGDLHNHTHIHGEPKFRCPEDGCDYVAHQKSAVYNHRRFRHSDEKPFSCDQCDYSGKSSTLLKSHQLFRHSDEKPFPCELCDYAAKTNDCLKIHMRTHTDSKPFQCTWPQCQYAARTSGAFAIHMRRHENRKDYQCSICPYATVSGSKLKDHMVVHSPEKPFRCEQCGATFKQAKTLTNHIRLIHTENPKIRTFHEENRLCEFFERNGVEIHQNLFVSYCGLRTEKSYARIDFCFPTKRTDVRFLLELDERQHKYMYPVADETQRMLLSTTSLRVSGEQRPIVWIRYNPNNFYVDGTKIELSKDDREIALLDFIQTFVPKRETSLVYMYYDCDDYATPLVTYDDDFAIECRDWLEDCIIE